MKKIILSILFLLMASILFSFSLSAFAATAFTVSVMPSAGDYTTLNAAMVANEVDLTASTTGVFSITGGITGTMTDNTAVTGLLSGATGTCAHASSVNSQILITSITGTFQSGEIVYETLGTNYVTLGSVRASPYLNIKIDGTWASADTTAVNITGYTTSATNYINIYTTPTARHTGKVGTGYTLASSITFVSQSLTVYITGLIISPDASLSYASGITVSQYSNAYISKNIIFPLNVTYNYNQISGISDNGNTLNIYAWNNIIYGFLTGSNYTFGIVLEYGGSNQILYAYNNTIYGNNNGIGILYGAQGYVKNNIVYNNVNADYVSSGTWNSSSTNNLSKDSTVPAYNTYYANATVTFNNAGSGDFSLKSTDTGATGLGANLSADSYIPFSDDIVGATRTVPWDIGAFKATAIIVTPHSTELISNGNLYSKGNLYVQ